MKIKAHSVLMPFWHTVKSNVTLLALFVLAGAIPPAGFAQDSITVANPSFEQGYEITWPHYNFPIPGWNASTAAIGLNDVTGPFWDNGATVDGTYAGFLQNSGTNDLLGQPTAGFQVGETYWVQFFANARTGLDTPDVSVFESASTAGGGALVSWIPIAPVGGAAGTGNPFTFINVPFTAATASGDLNLMVRAHNGGGAAASLVLDGVSIIRRSTNDVVMANPSFEASGTNQPSTGEVNDAVAGWPATHTGLRINQAGGSLADNGTIPDGGNVLGLISGAGVSQTLRGMIPGMNYQLSLYLNSGAATASPAALVRIGGSTAYSGSVAPVGGSNPYHKVSYAFMAASTNVTLTLSNATATATDSTLLVDNVRVVRQPDSITLANPSFEQGYNPTYPHVGTPPGWATSSPTPGINDATGPFWDNGGAVDSTQVGFIQNDGLLGQPASGFQVGESYWIQFFANAQIGSDTPDVAVYQSASTAGAAALVSGLNITPAEGAAGTGNPFTFINVPFTAAAANGNLNIRKTSHSGTDTGNATLLLDGFSIIRRSTNDVVIANPSFEASGTGQTSPGYNQFVAGWTKQGTGYLAINQAGGAFADNGAVPDGANVVALQSADADMVGISQDLHGLTPGKIYRLTLQLNERAYDRAAAIPSSAQALVVIDGQTAYSGEVFPAGVAGTANPYRFVSFDFVASAPDVTLEIDNLAIGGGSLLVDNVRVSVPPNVAPAVTAQPASATRYVGGTVTFTAAVEGFPPPHFQWKHDASNIAGATNQTLTLTNLQLAAAGNYILYATNSTGTTNTVAAALTVLPISPYGAKVIANNPMGYWRFSDGGGTNAFDYAGGNTAYDLYGGDLRAGPRPSAYPGFESTNTAPFLDGTSQGFASTVSLFNNLSNFTLMGWFNINPSQYPFDFNPYTHPQGRASLFGQRAAAELGFYDGNLLFFWSAGISQTIFVTNGFTSGQWYFVAAVSDAVANTSTLYLNGVAVGTASACPATANADLFSIGKNVVYSPAESGGYDNAFFPGSLDEVAAFSHALPASAIQAIYKASQSFSISISPQGAGLQVSWLVGHLESATNVTGPWGTVPGAVSPLSATPSGARKFYRAVSP